MKLDPIAQEYADGPPVGVLAVTMPDGSCHGATLHYALASDPARLFFMTGSDTRKAEALRAGGQVRASFVIGVDAADMRTLQMDGWATAVSDEDLAAFEAAYFGKFPEKRARQDEDSLLVAFAPQWWRFTDWTVPGGMVIGTDLA